MSKAKDEVHHNLSIIKYIQNTFRKAEPMNLELPKPMHEFKFTPVTSNEHEPPVKRFKEKIVTALDVCEGEVIHDSFRKRKIAKRNSRRRQEDDE